jgi:hypothetical protein
MNNINEVWDKLNEIVSRYYKTEADYYSSNKITKDEAILMIEELNKNEFGVIIDPHQIIDSDPENGSLNEDGLISYSEDIEDYNSSYDDDDEDETYTSY